MAGRGIMLQFPIPSTKPPPSSHLNNNNNKGGGGGRMVKLKPLPSSRSGNRGGPPNSKSLLAEETAQVSASPSRRRLILLRHAKSSWEDRSLRDHDRPLSKAGLADAIKVSHKLQQLGWIPQIILSSDALRTKQTLKIMQDQVRGFSEAEVHFISSFYSIAAMDGQTAEHLQQAICQYSRKEILTVMHFLWQDLVGGSSRMFPLGSRWCYPIFTSSKSVSLIKERMSVFSARPKALIHMHSLPNDFVYEVSELY